MMVPRVVLALAASLVWAGVSVVPSDAGAAFIAPFTVGQYAMAGSNCCGPPFEEEVYDPLAAHAEQNRGLLDGDAFGGWFSQARATPGNVGAESYLDYTNGQDDWSFTIYAESADILTLTNPQSANQTVTLFFGAGVSGGLAIAGGRPSASARAYFAFDGPVSNLRAANPPTSIPFWPAGFIFEDSALSPGYIYDPDTDTTTYIHEYEYSPRVDHLIDVMLDASGQAQIWVDLVLSVGVSDDDEELSYQSVATADYLNTVSGYVMALDPDLQVSSESGWSVREVPEPSSVALLGVGLIGLGAARRAARG